VQLFREFYWLIFPILGTGLFAFVIWTEFSRQKKVLEVLRAYAEKGAEPPESVTDALIGRRGNPWALFAYCVAMSIGSAVVAIWLAPALGYADKTTVFSFGVGALAMAAWAVFALVGALSQSRSNGR
jgi:hypothetical protein